MNYIRSRFGRTQTSGKSTGLFGVLILMVCLSVTGLNGCSSNYQASNSASNVYEFPIKPGTEAWKALASESEMIAACQIPDNKLRDMSTADLAETVLNYPLINNWWASDLLNWWELESTNLDFDNMVKQFNGLSELLTREDTGNALLAEYNGIDPASIKSTTLLPEQATLYFKVLNIEFLLSRNLILSQLTPDEIGTLLSRAKEIYNIKYLYPDYYSGDSQQLTSFLIEKVSRWK